MIEIKNLSKYYGDNSIFKNLNYKFPDKGLVCVLGASGTGKSTLLNMMAGFDTDFSGDIVVENASIKKLSKNELSDYRRDKIGFVFQDYILLNGYSVLDNILLACNLNNLSYDANKKNAQKILQCLGILNKANEKIENLSGGQKQRVAIARALIKNSHIILADEPTGSLDRKNADDIMALLKTISKEKLVVVITHDKKICNYADIILNIKDYCLIDNTNLYNNENSIKENKIINSVTGLQVLKFDKSQPKKPASMRIAFKNFKSHFKSYTAVAFAIAIGVLAFVLSLSFGNVSSKSINDFKQKNSAYNNGFIKNPTEEIFQILDNDDRIENVYYQYKLFDIAFHFDGRDVLLKNKYPIPKSSQVLSYGTLPQKGKNEIALSPSLAVKFQKNLKDLIGKKITCTYGEKNYELTISGVFNAEFDDFILSSDVECKLYEDCNKSDLFSISYDVIDFENIITIDNLLKEKNIPCKNAAIEVQNIINAFNKINRMFLIISILILIIGLFIAIVLLYKLQKTRYKEIGLYSALGFKGKNIINMIFFENIFLSLLTIVFNLVLLAIAWLIIKACKFALILTPLEIILSLVVSGFIVILTSFLANIKLIKTEPAVALRK